LLHVCYNICYTFFAVIDSDKTEDKLRLIVQCIRKDCNMSTVVDVFRLLKCFELVSTGTIVRILDNFIRTHLPLSKQFSGIPRRGLRGVRTPPIGVSFKK